MSMFDELLLGSPLEGIVRKDVYFALRTDGAFGDGGIENPYNATIVDDFENNLALIGVGVTIHFGPGVFLTNGGDGNSHVGKWRPKSGQRLIGSGVYSTTLKLIGAEFAGRSYSIIGSNSINPVNDVTIENMTLDCNLWGQPNSQQEGSADADYPRIMVSGVSITGSGNTVRRVRVINFGTNTPQFEYGFPFTPTTGSIPNSPTALECFPLILGMPDGGSSNNLIEDCILEQPGTNNARETTCLNLSGGYEYSGTPRGQISYQTNGRIRNCYVNCERRNPDPAKPSLKIATLTAANAAGVWTATLQTGVAHGRTVGDWIIVTGANIDVGASHMDTDSFNGSYQVSNVLSPTSLQYILAAAPAASPAAGDLSLDIVTDNGVAIKTVTADYLQPDIETMYFLDESIAAIMALEGPEATIETQSPHYKVPGAASGFRANSYAAVNGAWIGTNPVDRAINPYNGYFKVKSVGSPTKFKIMLRVAPSADASGAASPMLGVYYQAMSADGGGQAVVEGNRIFNCVIGGPYHDTWWTKDLWVHDNYYYNVNVGPFQSMGGMDSGVSDHNLAPMPGTLAQKSGSTTEMEFSIPTSGASPAPVLTVGQAIVISGGSSVFNGYFAITQYNPGTPPGPAIVTYAMKDNSGTIGAQTYALALLFQSGRLVYEDNIIELSRHPFQNFEAGAPVGINLSGGGTLASLSDGPWVFQNLLVRNNIIRHVDNLLDSNWAQNSLGVAVNSVKYAIIEGNLIDLEPRTADPLTNMLRSPAQVQACKVVRPMNNRQMDGQLVPVADIGKLIHYSEPALEQELMYIPL